VTQFDPSDLSNLSDLTAIEPAEFSRLVKSTPDATLAEVMSGPHRGAILDAIFERFPKVFRPEAAAGTTAVMHWQVGGAPGGGTDTYQVVIEDGACTTSATTDREPRLTLAMGPVEFLKLISGSGNPMMMFMTGKVKAKGDLGLATNLPKFFDLPKA
jgi:hypothetical protein